jgi:uncharacterized protein (TIGR02147 family)
MQKPEIFTYYDFRKYLEDFRIMNDYKHEYLCTRLGQKSSRTYFADVVKGRKNVTDEFVNRFVELLELNHKETVFFRTLVRYCQETNVKAKESYLKELTYQIAVQTRILTENEYAFYEEWHHSVIRAVLDIFDFRDDYKSLAGMIFPAITVAQAKKSIELLTTLQLIAPDENGYLRPIDKSIKTDEYVNTGLVRQYQLQCLDMAKMACMSGSEMPDDISTNIISISEEGFRELQERLCAFRKEVRSIVNNDCNAADRVYQLDIQLFPNSIASNKKKVLFSKKMTSSNDIPEGNSL